MSFKDPIKVDKPKENKRVARSTQTGFSSPATHYHEPRIDLNSVLVSHPDSTFFIRVKDDEYLEHGIDKKDVLIVDKSIVPKNNQLAIVILEGAFKVIRIGRESLDSIELWGTITYIIKAGL